MTLVIGIKAKDGIVIASDSQATSDLTSNDKVQKIFQIGNNSAVGISGDGGLATYFLDQIKGELNYSQGILKLAEDLRIRGKAKFGDFFENIPLEKRPKLTLVLVGYSLEGEAQVYTLKSEDDFVPRTCVVGYECIGVPYIADYILTGLYDVEVKVEGASQMAIYCLQETARQSGSGVGGETKVAIIDALTKTFKQMSGGDVEVLKQKNNQIQKLQKGIFFPEET